MRRRITAAIVGVTALAIALFGVPLAFVIRQLYITDAVVQLERENTLAARGIAPDFVSNPDIVDLPTNTKGILIGLYTPDGKKLSGNGPTIGDQPVLQAAANKTVERESNDRFVAATPVTSDEVVVAIMRAEMSTHAAEHRAHLAWALMAILGTIILGFAAALAMVQANRLTRPLRRVRDGATRLGHGDFVIDVPHSGVSELDDLTDALTATAKRLGQAMQRERSLATDASHQLRTPMAGLRLVLETELAAPRADPATALNECLDVTDRLETTVNDLLRLIRQPRRAEQLNVGVLTRQVSTHWNGPLATRGRRLEIVASETLPTVSASNAAIAQALDVLMDNALRHGTGTVSLTSERVTGGIALSVTDEGAIEHESSGPNPEGIGIGLDLAATLVEAEGGRLMQPHAGQRSTFTIVLTASSGSSD